MQCKHSTLNSHLHLIQVNLPENPYVEKTLNFKIHLLHQGFTQSYHPGYFGEHFVPFAIAKNYNERKSLKKKSIKSLEGKETEFPQIILVITYFP